TFVDVIDISRNDRPRLTRALRDARTRRWIVTVEVQHLSQRSKFSGRVFRSVSKRVVTIPNDRPLATAHVARDKCDLVFRTFDDLREVEVHVLVAHCLKT